MAQNMLLEITLSDWTPSSINANHNYVKIYEQNGQIIMSQLKTQPRYKYINQLPNKIICEHVFTPLELKLLKHNLDTILKSTKSFVVGFAPLGFEYDLEKSILCFEAFIKDYADEKNIDLIDDLKNKNKVLQDNFEQLQRSSNKLKIEFDYLIQDYNRLIDGNPKIRELVNKNNELEDLFQKEKFEKEQFIAYCVSLNDKIVELTND